LFRVAHHVGDDPTSADVIDYDVITDRDADLEVVTLYRLGQYHIIARQRVVKVERLE
jgi:hypothetical protein